MLEISGDQCHLFVHATPGAKRNRVGGELDGALRVAVSPQADKGKANAAIVKVLAKTLGVRPHQVTLARGATNRRKTFLITQPPAGLADLVAELADES